jgi:hypothetical protein
LDVHIELLKEYVPGEIVIVSPAVAVWNASRISPALETVRSAAFAALAMKMDANATNPERTSMKREDTCGQRR